MSQRESLATAGASASAPAVDASQRRLRGAGGAARSPWIAFLARRFGGLVLAFFVIATVTFIIVPLIPGDPAIAVAGPEATKAEVDLIREQLGLNLPLWQQYVAYLGNVVVGDLGTSYMWNQPVAEIVIDRMMFTLPLALGAMVVVLAIAIPLGVAVGILTRGGRRAWLDRTFGFVTGLFSTIPSYVLATLLIVIFAIWLGLLPPVYSRRDPALAAILPIIALSIGPICTIARVVRRETENVNEQDYMRTARGWRLGRLRLIARYLIPNILTVTLTLSGLILTSLLGGAVVVETVFSWPGMGTAVITSIVNRDYPLIQGLVLTLGIIATLITLLVDVLLGLVDSRTLGGKNGR